MEKSGSSFHSSVSMIIILARHRRTEFNPLKKRGHKKVVYISKTYLDGVEWNNKVHEIYLNAEVKDGSKLSEMLQYFKTADPEDNRFGPLSDAVKKQKNFNREVTDMCSAVEEYAKEYAKEYAEKETTMTKVEFVNDLINDGCTLEKALKLAKIDEETYNKYKTA